MASTTPNRGKRPSATQLHRWLGIAAAIFFLLVSVTGVVLQTEHLFGEEEEQKEAMAQLVSPASLGAIVAPDPAALDRARLALLGRFGDRKVDAIDWQIKGSEQHFIFHLGNPDPQRVDVNAASAQIVDVRPDGEDWLLRLHTGEIVGDGGKVIGLLWGLGLVFMGITGVMIYLKLLRARRGAAGSGLRKYFW